MKFNGVILSLSIASAALAQTNEVPVMTFPRWSPSIQAGSVYNFDSDLSDNGSFSVNRYYIEAGLTRMWSLHRMISFSVGYGQEDYNFDGLPIEPWNNIDSYRAGLFARWSLSDEWMLFLAPSVQSYVETGADLGDGFGASLFTGVGYQFGDTLFLGPALGVFGRIEDSPLILPIILVDWNITDQLSLGTGRGFGARSGPGLALTYELNKNWNVGLTGRYESFRFRLSPENGEPNGIGEDQSVSLLSFVTYELFPGTYVSGLLGSKIGGEISLFDENDREVESSDYGSGVVGGFVFGLRL